MYIDVDADIDVDVAITKYRKSAVTKYMKDNILFPLIS